MKTILGLDLGVASIGWGLIKVDLKNWDGKIIKSGVRIFQGNELRADAAPGESSNADRRTKRSVRNQRDRRGRRKAKLYTKLKKLGFAPDKRGWEEWIKINPYEIRSRALKESVSLHELGRALYHLNQRRGYKSNRKAGNDSEGPVKDGISKVREHMLKYEAKTIGDYFYKIYSNHLDHSMDHDDFDRRIRNKYTHRAMFMEEYDRLWDSQKRFHPELSARLQSEIKNIIFHQRKLKSQSHLIGKCELETDKKRISKAHLLYQEFRIIKNLNNLSIADENGLEIYLSEEDKKAMKEIFGKRDSVTWDSLKKILIERGTIGNKNAAFNLERGGRKRIEGNRTNSSLSNKNAFGDEWYELDEEFKNHVVDVLINVDKPDVVKRLALEKWGRTEKQADYITHNLSLEQSYGGFSEKAIKKLLPYLTKGLEESTAIKEAGYSLFEQNPGKTQQLPMPGSNIKNPVVYHALIELRKVVNAIIRKYGMPDIIRVELTRDLKAGYEQRQKMNKNMRTLEKKNDKARKALQNAPFYIQYPSYNDIIWYNLWEECDKICPYTGKTIPAEAFNSGEFQIEHIIPFSKSLDNSYANKTLCEADFNRIKGNRTPWECVISGLIEEDDLLQRIRNLPWNKRNKFTQKNIDTDKFLNRQLNDTRYISREASSYLKNLACESVEVVKGQTTSLLRHVWGLNSVLNKEDDNMKNRDDHRHHAVDAIVVAMTNRSILKRLSDENKQIRTADWMDIDESSRKISQEMKRRLTERIGLQEPWPAFRNEVERSINDIVVSHRVNRKVSGALHKETFYGITHRPVSKGKKIMTLRKPVHQLKVTKRTNDIECIRDERVRKIIQSEIEQRMQQGITKQDAISSFETDPPYIISAKAKVPIKRVRLEMEKDFSIYHHFENNEGRVVKYAQYGNNHHISIYTTKNKNGKKKQVGFVIPMMEAARRIKDGEPIISKNYRPDHMFLFSLSKNDMVINHDDGKIYRVQKIDSSTKINFRHQFVALKKQSEPGILRKIPNTLNASKIKVSPIGEIFPAND